MAGDARKHQKKLERRAAKRKAHARDVVRRQNLSFADRLGAADRFPLLHCTVNAAELDRQGIGWVCVSRELPNGSVANALFLVDRYCLGVKNAIAQVLSRFVYEDKVVRKLRAGGMAAQDWDLAAARKLVEDAVAYAAQFGFAPHPDYEQARAIFGSVDPASCTQTFEFGKDGKPFYISGPNDSMVRSRQILKALDQHCGAGGFDTIVRLEAPTDHLALADHEDDENDEDTEDQKMLPQ